MSITTTTQARRYSSGLSSHWKSPMTSITSPGTATELFPNFDDESANNTKDDNGHQPTSIKYSLETLWQPRRNGTASRPPLPQYKKRSRKSISEAIGSFRTRGTSVSENAHHLAEALKAPISYRLVGLCILWYMTSALTNTSSKSILNALPKPITLTIVQFAFVSTWCLFLTYLASVFPALRNTIPALRQGIRAPTVDIITTALPLAIFSLLGHILSSMATSKIPVSLVHTIKGLSPLFTVVAYRVFFRIRYAKATYLSLVPLTLGVMLACSSGFSTNFYGIFCALSAAMVFVTQNIFSKKIFNEVARAEMEGQTGGERKLDKLNLLYYCSGLAFILTLPIWFLSEGYPLLVEFLRDGAIDLSNKRGALDHGPLMLEFFFNGTFHFGQNILAFVLLSMISPVSYSVASLIKRVFVVVVAIVWFGNSTTAVQGFGIALTFFGLYLYDRNKQDDAADRRANADSFRKEDTILPLSATTSKSTNLNGYAFPQHMSRQVGRAGSVLPPFDDSKKELNEPNGNTRRNSIIRPLPGTKQESTWKPSDVQLPQRV
ncbi:suppressor of loss of ypt1 [Myotisia sp. PD_48]|nr:suppressor of loss of ypt1 [Myotisia sp. PD_48]